MEEELRRLDAAFALPRLGGMARPDGVVIVSERFWAFAGTDGSVREGTMPAGPRRVRRIPLLRGLARLWLSLSPLFRGGTGVAGPRERLLVLAAVVAPFLLYLAPKAAQLPVGLGVSAALLAWMLRGRTLRLHGAEHRAIRAVDERSLAASWGGIL